MSERGSLEEAVAQGRVRGDQPEAVEGRLGSARGPARPS